MTDIPTDNFADLLEVEKDALFSILATERCRHVLRYFHESSRAMTSVDELVAYAVERDETIVSREEAAIVLRHVELPKLADAGVIEYDGRTTVRYRGHPLLEVILRLVAEGDGGT